MSGNKISDTSVFPVTTPADDDLLIGTDISDTSLSAGGRTVNFPVGSLGWTLVSEQSPTSGTTVTWTGLSGYRELRLTFYGLTSSSAGNFELVLSADNGSTFANSASDYVSSSSDSSSSDDNDASIDLHPFTSTSLSGEVVLRDFNQASVKTSTVHATIFQGTVAAAGFGYRDTAEANDALRVTISAGAFTSGSVALFGRK